MKVYFFLASFILLDIADIPVSPSGCSCTDDVEVFRTATDKAETELPAEQVSVPE